MGHEIYIYTLLTNGLHNVFLNPVKQQTTENMYIYIYYVNQWIAQYAYKLC